MYSKAMSSKVSTKEILLQAQTATAQMEDPSCTDHISDLGPLKTPLKNKKEAKNGPKIYHLIWTIQSTQLQ